MQRFNQPHPPFLSFFYFCFSFVLPAPCHFCRNVFRFLLSLPDISDRDSPIETPAFWGIRSLILTTPIRTFPVSSGDSGKNHIPQKGLQQKHSAIRQSPFHRYLLSLDKHLLQQQSPIQKRSTAECSVKRKRTPEIPGSLCSFLLPFCQYK